MSGLLWPGHLKSTIANHSPMPEATAGIIAYHQRTKHHPERYASGPHGLDWATQPNPFRRYAGAPLLQLPLADSDNTPPAAALFGAATVAPRPLTLEALGLFFELSLGLSARKQIANSSWYLRMNPSSGNLHPTEAYVVLPDLAGLSEGQGVYHYAPFEHALERRARWKQAAASEVPGFHVGLTSITWREAWKYGERAFRYCQHDVGHALAAIRFAATALGWRVQFVPEWSDARLARLLGLDRAEDFENAEMETPELLILVKTRPVVAEPSSPVAGIAIEWFGRANRLSDSHVEWPAIDEAVEASERITTSKESSKDGDRTDWSPPSPPVCNHSASRLIRQRRSAVDFDGITSITRVKFLSILDATLPRAAAPPFDTWPFTPRLHLVVFVHRVIGLESGLYLWLRAPADAEALRHALNAKLKWEPVTDSAISAPLFRLGGGDLREFARMLSCHQDIAADGAFSLGMLARFEPVLRERGAAAYRELFWEAGMIGQALYLAAEAAGVRGTGSGCYFDDVLHKALGLTGNDWQSLYHFTIGSPVEDLRLRTAPPYAHLAGEAGAKDLT
jgi:SagB-type dehydrogenase family enzyme